MFKKVERVVVWFEKTLAVCFLTIMIMAVGTQVLSRYFLPVPVSWTEELARYSLIWLTFIGASMAIHSKGHFVLNVILNKMAPKIKYAIQIGILLLLGAFLAVNAYSSAAILKVLQYQTSAALQIPMSYVYLSMPVASIFMLIHIIVQLLDKFKQGLNSEQN
jgi:TRAP-type C4-dicarboxylate transport system, small permease component